MTIPASTIVAADRALVDAPSGRVIERETGEAGPCLDDTLALEVAALVRGVQGEDDLSVDVEWAFAEERSGASRRAR